MWAIKPKEKNRRSLVVVVRNVRGWGRPAFSLLATRTLVLRLLQYNIYA